MLNGKIEAVSGMIKADCSLIYENEVDHGNTIWGKIVYYFHSVLYFFAHLFGIK